MSICIFPGTFNPIHNAHLEMAEYALEKYNFEKIIFIPAYIPPHKDISKKLALHRYKMVELAISQNPKFEISDIEFNSEEPSYSLITVQKIIKQYEIVGKLNFLMGTDSFENLKNWYKADELKNLVHFIVFPRCPQLDKKKYQYYFDNEYDFEFTKMNYIDISSTQLRKNRNFTNTTKQVGAYIKENELYIA